MKPSSPPPLRVDDDGYVILSETQVERIAQMVIDRIWKLEETQEPSSLRHSGDV
jgi:hypothetical protein